MRTCVRACVRACVGVGWEWGWGWRWGWGVCGGVVCVGGEGGGREREGGERREGGRSPTPKRLRPSGGTAEKQRVRERDRGWNCPSITHCALCDKRHVKVEVDWSTDRSLSKPLCSPKKLATRNHSLRDTKLPEHWCHAPSTEPVVEKSLARAAPSRILRGIHTQGDALFLGGAAELCREDTCDKRQYEDDLVHEPVNVATMCSHNDRDESGLNLSINH